MQVCICKLKCPVLSSQPPLLQILQDLSPGSAEDGDARQVWWKPGGDGADAGEGGWRDYDDHGQLCLASGGH